MQSNDLSGGKITTRIGSRVYVTVQNKSSIKPIDPATVKKEQEKIIKINDTLNNGQNYILMAELNMLQRKYQKAGTGVGEEPLEFGGVVGLETPRFLSTGAQSALWYDLYGGFRRRRTWTADPFDVITGRRAINESLQLGSVRAGFWNDPDTQLLQEVKRRLEDYKRDNKKYPQNLKEFSNIKENYKSNVWYQGKSQNIADLAHIFEYQVTPDGKYTLRLKDTGQTFTLADIRPLQIRSHPWTQMLQGHTIQKSDIFSFIPQDHFLVYFQSAKKL